MHELPLAELERASRAFDDDVLAAPLLDRFCSASDWILPANRALMPPRRPWLHRSEAGWVALMAAMHPRGFRYLEPLEAMWGLSCPLVGASSIDLARAFVELCRLRRDDWDVLALTGIFEHSGLAAALVTGFAPWSDVRLGASTIRHVASLEGGVDGFLARRSRNFRKGLRRAARLASQAGVTFERCHLEREEDAEALFDRILRIEMRSWKGSTGVGIDGGAMHDFYRIMIARLIARGAQRTIFARHQDRDIGYVFGGVIGTCYRGLQFSYDADYHEQSLGSLLQLEQITELCETGYQEYDLGTEMDYKRRWAERQDESLAVIIIKR